MSNNCETVLAARHARLQLRAALILQVEVLPERIPPAGVVILRDGQPAGLDVTMSPLRDHDQHRTEIGVIVQATNGRATASDPLIVNIGAAVEADRTFGGLCNTAVPEAPAMVDMPIEGAAALNAAVITVVLQHSATGPQSCANET
jgi:hypothetical protein